MGCGGRENAATEVSPLGNEGGIGKEQDEEEGDDDDNVKPSDGTEAEAAQELLWSSIA